MPMTSAWPSEAPGFRALPTVTRTTPPIISATWAHLRAGYRVPLRTMAPTMTGTIFAFFTRVARKKGTP